MVRRRATIGQARRIPNKRYIGKIMKKKCKIAFIGAICCVAALTGAMRFRADISAKAAEDYQSVGERYFYSDRGKLESFLNKAATSQPLYKDVRTEIEDLTVGEDVTVYYNGLISPTATNLGVVYYDEYNADAMILTYTLASDRNKQLSLINIKRGDAYYFSVALTDDIEIRDGYAYIQGTEQKTIGIESSDSDAVYSGEGFRHVDGTNVLMNVSPDGGVHVKASDIAANILSEAFLEQASAELEGTKYASLYTEEYVRALLSDFGSGVGNNTSIFSLTYKSVHNDHIAFHLRGISGQWIGDSGGTSPWNGGNTYGFATQKKTTVYLNAPNNLADLFDLHCIYIASGETQTKPYGVGFFGTDENGNGGTWFDIKDGQSSFTYTPREKGKFYVKIGGYIASDYSALGSYSPTTVFEFDVIDGNPVVEGVKNATAIEGMSYDMSSFFEVWHLGATDKANFSYEVDGVPQYDSILLADGNTHEIKLTVTDEYGNSGSAVHTVLGTRIELASEISHAEVFGNETILPVPHTDGVVSYTIEVKNSEGNVVTRDAVYMFEQEGVYTLKYTFFVNGATPITKTSIFKLTFRSSIPTITVNGTYEKEYYFGQTLKMLSATATDESGTIYDVTVNAYFGEEKVSAENGEIYLEREGVYTIAYECRYAAGLTMRLERAFRVKRDEIAPEIVVKGTYAEKYEKGSVVSVFEFVASDDSGLLSTAFVKAYVNGTELQITDEKVLELSQDGTYEIVYTAIDFSGNKKEERYTFSVATNKTSGCNATLGGVSFVTMALFCAILIICKRENA